MKTVAKWWTGSHSRLIKTCWNVERRDKPALKTRSLPLRRGQGMTWSVWPDLPQSLWESTRWLHNCAKIYFTYKSMQAIFWQTSFFVFCYVWPLSYFFQQNFRLGLQNNLFGPHLYYLKQHFWLGLKSNIFGPRPNIFGPVKDTFGPD